MPTWIKGFDIAFSRATRPWWKARYQEGCRVCVQNLWTGGYNRRLQEVAEANLTDARAEGLLIAGYGNANPWYSMSVCMHEMALNAGSMWDALPIVAADVELPGVTETHIQSLCWALKVAGKKVPIYSAAWFWKETIGNPMWPWLLEHKLWEAYYDGDPDIDFLSRRFGPWELTDIVGEQYQGTTLIDGVDVDLNVFDLDYWRGDNMTPEEQKRLNEATAGVLNLQAEQAATQALLKAIGTLHGNPWSGLPAALAEVKKTAEFWHRWPPAA